MRSEGYFSRSCLSVNQHLTSRAFVRLENDTTYSAGSEGQNFMGFCLKPLRCRDPALPTLYGHMCSRPFVRAENAHAHYFYHVLEVERKEDGLKLREFWLSCLRATFAHNVKLVYH